MTDDRSLAFSITVGEGMTFAQVDAFVTDLCGSKYEIDERPHAGKIHLYHPDDE